MKRYSIVLSLVAAVCGIFFASTVQAASVDIVQGRVLEPDGSTPIEDMAVYLYGSDGTTYVDYITTNSSGYFNFFTVTEGDYVVSISPGESLCSCGLYQSQTDDITVSTASASGGTQSLGNYTMVQATTFATVTVTDGNGTPVEGVSMSAWNDDYNSGEYGYGETDENGQWQTAVDNGDAWSFYAYKDGYSSADSYGVSMSTGENTVELEMEEADATINLTLRNSSGQAVPAPNDGYGSASCYNSDWTRYFWGDITPGQSTAAVSVVGPDTYTCSVWIDGFASDEVTALVGDGATVNKNVTVLEADSTIRVKLVDENGNRLTDVTSFSAYANSTLNADGEQYWGSYAWEDGSNGLANLEVVDGFTYEVGVWVNNDSGSGISSTALYTATTGTQYIQNYNMQTVVADNSQTRIVEVELQEADAEINVTVLDSDGTPAEYAWVSAEENGVQGWGSYIGDVTNSNGEVTLAVAGDKTYNVAAYPMGAYDGTTLPPRDREVRVAENGSKSITMRSLVSDWTVNISADTDDSTDLDYVWCHVYSPSLGVETFADLVSGSGSAGIISDNSWWIGCQGYALGNGGDGTFYRSADTQYTSGTREGGSGSVEVTLSEAGEYYEEQTFSFSATSDTTLELQDGSTLTVPANSIDSSGTVTITSETAVGQNVDDENYPAEPPFELTARDSSGQEVEEFQQNLTLNFHYDEDELEELGIDEDELKGAAYDEDTNSWQNPASSQVDTDENVVTVGVNHFSAYGILGNRGLRDNSCSARRITRKTRNRVRITLDNGQRQTLRAFRDGRKKPLAKFTKGKQFIVTSKKNGKGQLRVYNACTMERVASKKLRNKKQKNVKLATYNTYRNNRKQRRTREIVVATKKGNAIKVTPFSFNTNTEVLKKRTSYTVQNATDSTFTLVKKKKNVLVKRGSTLLKKFKLVKKARVIKPLATD